MSNFSNFYAKRLKKGHFKDFFFAIKRSTANNFYAKRLKKVLFEQLKKMIPKSGGGHVICNCDGGYKYVMCSHIEHTIWGGHPTHLIRY